MNISTYYLTPQERVSMAYSRISERKTSQYAQAKQLQSYAQQQEQQVQNARNDSTISRIGQTLGDIFGNLAGGLVGAFEGIIDFGATVVGGIGGLFDDDFQKDVQDFVSYNWTQDKVINPILEGTQGSYINDASENVRNIVRGVASGVGQMLPAVAVTVATGGLGAPAAFAQGAGLATIGLSAAGGGVQEAFQEGADYGEALGYGILSGGLEVAIEKLSGGLGKQFIGKGLTDDLIKNVARKVTTNQAAQKGLRILMEAGGEAAEEWTSEFLNPYLKRMTYDSDAELSTQESRLEAALIGGLTSLAFRGTIGQINTHTQQASEALSELQTLEQKESKLWGDDKLTETKQKEIDDFRLETKQTLSEQLQKMSNKRRADFISSYKLEDMVNADGTLKGAQSQAESVVGETDGAQAQSVVEGEQTAQKPDYNRAAYSPALYGKESELRFAPTQSALTADEVKAKQYFSKLNRGKRNANLVFTDDMPDVGGAFARGAQDKNTVYINRKANAMEQVIVHEMTHFARGTKEYKKLQDFVLRESNQEFIDGLAQDISETYGIDLQELVQKSRNFDKLSVEEAEQFSKDYSEVLDEVVATYVSEHIFTDEKAINSLAEDNRSLVKRIYKWIKNKIEVLTKGKTKAERDAIKYLQKAEKLYANALESAVGVADGTKRYSLSEQKDSKGNTLTEAQAEFFKDSKIRDKNGNLLVVYHGTSAKFNKFTRSKMGKTGLALGEGYYFTPKYEAAQEYAKGKSARIIECYLDIKNPLMARTAPNEAAKAWIDSFKDKYSEEFLSEMSKSSFSLLNFVKDYVETTGENTSSILKSFGYDGIDFINEIVAFDSNQIKLTTNENPTKSDDIRYSLVSKKDSEGKTLTDEQIEFFKDSEVRDENDNLKVLYHGTMSGDFTVFDSSLANVESDMGAGFYFSDTYSDVSFNYEKGGQDLDNKIEILAERIENEEDISYDEALEKARKQMAKSSKLFEVYLNIKNPAYIGGDYQNDTYLFGEDFTEQIESDIDTEEDAYYEELDELFADVVDSVDEILSAEGISGYEGWQNYLQFEQIVDGITITELKNVIENNLYDVYDESGNIATNELVRAIVQALGYDGIIDNSVYYKFGNGSGRKNYMKGIDERTNHYIAFSPEQIKLTTNKKPTSSDDIRFSLSPRQIAERTLPKKYTKSDAKRALDDIMGNLLYDNDSKAGEIKGKNKTAVLDMLYRSLNEAEVGKRINYADRIAEYIINNAAAVDLYEDETNYENIAVLDTTKDYLRKINLSDKGIRAEIESRYGKDYAKVIYSMWGARKGEAGVGADVAYSEIVNQLGFGQDINNEADAFFQIADWYVEARDALRKKANETLDATLRENERAEIKAEIVRNVLKSFEKYGEETQLYQLVKRYEKRIAELKDLVTETKQYNRLLNKAIDSVAKISTLNNKDFAPASQLHDDRFKPLISKLSKIKWRSELIRPATRDIVVEFGDTFYNASNPFLTDAYQDEVANAIGYLRERKQYFEQEGIKAKSLDAEELRMLNIVTDNIYHVFKNYDTFIKDGKRESVTEYAKRGVDIVDKSAKNGGKDNFVSRVVKKGSTFIKNVVDPATVMKWGDGFYTENGKAAGVMFELYNAVRLSETQAKSKYIELITPLEDFFKKTKGYRKHYTTATVTIAGKEIPLGVAMSLSLTAKQNDVWGYTNLKGEYVENGLGTEGFGYVDKNGDFVTVGAVTKAQIAEMENQFTSEDKQYLGLVRDFFDKGTSPLLRETDMTRKGYTTVNKQNYFPTQRYEGGIAKDIIGMSQYQAMTSTLANPSFLKERKTGARGKYQIGDIFSIVQKHGVFSTCYAYMAMPLENFSRVYNKNVAENDAPVRSLKTEVNEKIWSGFDKYLTNLFGDISQSNRARDFGQNLLDKLMSNYAKFQLGFNPKTIVGQTSSYPMALIRLDMRALAYGLRKVNFKQLDKYCPYAKVRDYEGSIVRAQSMTDNIGKVGDALTKPIQKVDRLTCGLIFNACQWQVQKEQGFKIGTEENLVAAGKLAEEVIRDTQSNSVITEKSGLMRNKNMVVRWFTMFSSDAMKQVSRFVESIGEYNALRRRIKNGETGQEAYLKKMRDKIARTTTAILVSNLMFVLVGQFFKWLYDKDRIDKEGNEISVWEDLANDYIGQIIGLLPVARDIYSFLGEGYEVNGFIYGTINDLLGATDDIVKVVSKIAKGEVTDTPDFMLPLRNSIYAVGQLLGIPTRNIYNVFYGLTKRFSPESAYKVNSLFYDAYLTSDLNEAIEKGDDDLAQTIVGVIMDGEGMAEDEAIQRKIVELAKQGFSAIPRRLGDTITYNGEQIKLTNNQAKRFAEVYGGANNAVKQLLQNSGFDNLAPEVQAKSIKFVYDYYWQLALEDMLGEGLEEKKLLFATAIPIDKLAYIVSYCQSLESDKDRKGNTVSGSLKTKITTFVNRQTGLSAYQKYMVMAYLGYRSTTAESKIKAYVNRLDLTKSQREKLLEYCGY